MNFRDITGQRFGRLVATEAIGRTADGQVKWRCLCDCGKVHEAAGGHLRQGDTKSCGCLNVDVAISSNTTHGAASGGRRTREYDAWSGMITRCEDPKTNSYPDYGGRGISVCPRWRADFANFLADMGLKPTASHSIDRKDGNGNYEPGNCKWATRKEQNVNRRNVRMFTHAGETLCMKDWARRAGTPYITFRARLERGWTIQEAVEAGQNGEAAMRKQRDDG